MPVSTSRAVYKTERWLEHLKMCTETPLITFEVFDDRLKSPLWGSISVETGNILLYWECFSFNSIYAVIIVNLKLSDEMTPADNLIFGESELDEPRIIGWKYHTRSQNY